MQKGLLPSLASSRPAAAFRRRKGKSMNKVYEIITQKILEQLQEGKVPWERPWIGGMPFNLVSGKRYSGVNIWLLQAGAYLTFKQIKDLGGMLEPGSKSTLVVFWQNKKGQEVKDDGKTESYEYRILRYYQVFSANQVTWNKPLPPAMQKRLDETKGQREFNSIEEAEKIIAGYKNSPQISFGGNQACYSSSIDEVCLPLRESFTSEQGFYSTYFHELTHSTGHNSRLDRPLGNSRYGKGEKYAFEELIAELGQAYLMNTAGLDSIKHSVAYCQSWLGTLQNNPDWIIKAASKSQKAADYILGI